MQPKVSEYLVNYRKLKEERIQYLKNNYSGKKNTIRKTPWFMLTKGKQYNYEQRKETWGKQTDYFKVDSEMKKLTKKYVILRGIRGEYKYTGYIEHKLNKWIKKHPKPCDERDLFAQEYLTQWNEEKEKAKFDIQEKVLFKYINIFTFDNSTAEIYLKRYDSWTDVTYYSQFYMFRNPYFNYGTQKCKEYKTGVTMSKWYVVENILNPMIKSLHRYNDNKDVIGIKFIQKNVCIEI